MFIRCSIKSCPTKQFWIFFRAGLDPKDEKFKAIIQYLIETTETAISESEIQIFISFKCQIHSHFSNKNGKRKHNYNHLCRTSRIFPPKRSTREIRHSYSYFDQETSYKLQPPHKESKRKTVEIDSIKAIQNFLHSL